MIKKVVLFVFLLLGGCAYKNPLSDMKFQTVMAPPYVVAGWYKIQKAGDPLKVYIEGDGHAFDAQGRPTDNPTPTGVFLRELASEDPSPNVVYLGRPCQYLQAGACSEKDWTDGRFSKEIINSMNQYVLTMMKKARSEQLVLVGFSGGAQIAGWIGVKNPKQVKKLITIAGVLDHEAWTRYHGDMPLTKSLNLTEKKKDFLKLNQVHYAGENDKVVPVKLIQDFVGVENLVVVPKATHGDGFKSIYNEIYEVR